MANEGRPSKYSSELVEELCHRIAEGRSLRSVCRDEDMPHRDTVRSWLADPSHEEEFRRRMDFHTVAIQAYRSGPRDLAGAALNLS